VNHIRFPKEDHLPDCARWDNQRVESCRMSWAGFIVITQNVIEKPERNNHLEDLGFDMRIIQRNRVCSGIVLHRFMNNGGPFRTSELHTNEKFFLNPTQ